jgi:TFIIS helical bundle-like domain
MPIAAKVRKMLEAVFRRNPSLDIAGQGVVALQAGVEPAVVHAFFREQRAKKGGADSSDEEYKDDDKSEPRSDSGDSGSGDDGSGLEEDDAADGAAFRSEFKKGTSSATGQVLAKQVPSFLRAVQAANTNKQRVMCARSLGKTKFDPILSRLHSDDETMERLVQWLVLASKVTNDKPNGHVELLTNLLEAFDRLPISLETLRRFSVGKLVNRLKKSGTSRIQRHATVLVQKWAKLLGSSPRSRKPAAANANSSAPKPSNLQQQAPPPAVSPSQSQPEDVSTSGASESSAEVTPPPPPLDSDNDASASQAQSGAKRKKSDPVPDSADSGSSDQQPSSKRSRTESPSASAIAPGKAEQQQQQQQHQQDSAADSSMADADGPSTATPKSSKSVSWPADSELTKTKFFLSEDKPDRGFPSFSEAKRHEFEMSEAETARRLAEHQKGPLRAFVRIPWRTRAAVGALPDYNWPTATKRPEIGQNTPEAVNQRQREAKIGMPVVYLDPAQAPSSPAEPNGTIAEPQRKNADASVQAVADANVPAIPWNTVVVAAAAAASHVPVAAPPPVAVPQQAQQSNYLNFGTQPQPQPQPQPLVSPGAPAIDTTALAQLLGTIGQSAARAPVGMISPSPLLSAGGPAMPHHQAQAQAPWQQPGHQSSQQQQPGSGFGALPPPGVPRRSASPPRINSNYEPGRMDGPGPGPGPGLGSGLGSGPGRFDGFDRGAPSRYSEAPHHRPASFGDHRDEWHRQGDGGRRGDDRGPRERGPGFVSKIPCRNFFGDSGRCRFADDCQFSHDPEVYARNGYRISQPRGDGRGRPEQSWAPGPPAPGPGAGGGSGPLW